ncbi:hypothetical protein X975_08948, partial [Stegodyphus mimosarum]
MKLISTTTYLIHARHPLTAISTQILPQKYIFVSKQSHVRIRFANNRRSQNFVRNNC